MTQFNERFHAKAVERIVSAMNEPEGESERWNSGADMSECFGWDGNMSPITRHAFVTKYGEEVTATLEAEAAAKVAKMRQLKTDSAHARHEREAAETAKKPVNEWVVGDFVVGLDCGLKFDHENIHAHLWDFVEGEKEDAKRKITDEYRHVSPRLCKITRIIEKPGDFFNGPNALQGYQPLEHEGGSCSEDVPDGMTDVELSNLPKDERQAYYDTFYSLVVLVRSASGEYVLIDAEGYSYARYVLVPQDYRTMFAPVIEIIRAKKEQERMEREAAAKAEHDKAKAEYDARCVVWAHLMRPVSSRWDYKEIKANILAMAKAAFPGVYFTIRKPDGWGSGYTLSWRNGPTEDEVKDKTDFGLFAGSWDEFDSMTDCSSIAKARFTEFAEKFGWAKNGVDLERIEAETDRNHEPSEALAEAPAVVSVDGEVSVTENTEKNGIEIRFARKPSADVLARIKARRCWRWSKFSKCWYTRANAVEREFANALAEGRDNRRHEDVPGNLDAMLGY